jgi:hypothetical protein
MAGADFLGGIGNLAQSIYGTAGDVLNTPLGIASSVIDSITGNDEASAYRRRYRTGMEQGQLLGKQAAAKLIGSDDFAAMFNTYRSIFDLPSLTGEQIYNKYTPTPINVNNMTN